MSLETMISQKNKLIGYGAVAFASLVIALCALAYHYDKVEQDYSKQISNLNTKISETEFQRLSALSLVDEARLWNEASKERIVELEKKLARKPMPPPARKTPATVPELTASLERAGLFKGLAVLEEAGPSTMGRGDASLAFQWSEQAVRVPALEERLQGQEDLLKGYIVAVNAGENELLKTRGALDITTKQLSLTAGQMKNIQGEAQAAAKKAKLQKWLWAGGGLLTGYFVSRK